MNRKRVVLGWIALGISTLIAALWAFWGILEAFHEGWWAATLTGRLLQTSAYLTPMALCLMMGALAIRWPKVGAAIYFSLGAAFSWLIFGRMWPDFKLAAVLSWAPVTLLVVGVGVLWWFGQPRPMRLAYCLFVGIPLLVALGFGALPAYRVSTRHTDVSLEAQLVQGNGVALVWAPAGPGWVRTARRSANWLEAVDRCARLGEDGQLLLEEPQHIWRLPTVEEAVRSMARHGVNCGGSWNAQTKRASYRVLPDKEPPLWDPFAETIYWWTATEDGEDRAFIIVYDGKVWSRSKTSRLGSQGFRAVKDPPGEEPANQPAPGRN